MADKELVLCEPLCFIVNKFGKLAMKVMKSTVMDFYDVDTLAAAKSRLLDDVNLMDIADKLPHIPKRRDNANRLTHETEDIFALLQFIDERGLLSDLPRYVSSGPDNMPSTRLFDGDMLFLLVRLDKLENNLVGVGSTLAAITAELHGLRQATNVRQVSSTIQPNVGQQPSLDDNSTNTGVNVTSQYETVTMGNSTTSTNNSVNNHQPIPANPSWAERFVKSTPSFTQSKRLVNNQPHGSVSNSESTEDQPYTLVQSRRKRLRAQSNEPANNNNNVKSNKQNLRRGKPLLVGKLDSSSSLSLGITAARHENQFTKKSIFYIGNVDNSVSVEQMHNFVTSMSVEVLSLFETKPRLRRLYDASSEPNKAFRLCINKDHRERLLVESKWPAYISVSEWFFKSTATTNAGLHRDITISASSLGPSVGDNGDDDQATEANNAFMDADETILACDHSQSPFDQSTSFTHKNGVSEL
jgi:hypothetical protein